MFRLGGLGRSGVVLLQSTSYTQGGGGPKGDWYGPVDLPSDMAARRPMTSREQRVERLALEVFSKGNQYLKGVLSLESLPEGVHSFPEVCFIGAPNSGKSSLIGALCHNPKMARTGAKPGLTRNLQFYMIGGAMSLVDCPGYGNWIAVDDRRLAMARGIGVMFQYLALRSRANLRRVYWVIEASKSHRFFRPTPRDEELLRFLYTERIPFSIVLNKVDRYGLEDHNRIVCDTGAIYDFLGTTSVPILDTISLPSVPDIHRNIHKLRSDIMLHITNQLQEAELTVKGLSSLGYLPFTAEEQLRVEERYPMNRIVLPHRDDYTLESVIDYHQNAKRSFIEFHRLNAPMTVPMGVLETSTNEGLVGFKDNIEKISADIKADAAQWLDRKAEHAGRLVWGQATSGNQQLIGEGAAAHRHRSYLPDHSTTHQQLSVDENAESTVLVPASPSMDITLIANTPTTSVVAPPPSSQPISALGGVMPTSAAIAALTGPPPLLSLPRGVAEAFPFKHIPDSMISHFFERDLAKVDKRSWGALKESQDDLSYESFLGSEFTHFVEESPDDQERGSINAAKKKVFNRYLNANRKERYQNLTSAASMCPWVGNPKEGSVLGLETDAPSSSSHSGSVVRHLRDRGFGGRSVSPNTLKRRGRATVKVGKWAR